MKAIKVKMKAKNIFPFGDVLVPEINNPKPIAIVDNLNNERVATKYKEETRGDEKLFQKGYNQAIKDIMNKMQEIVRDNKNYPQEYYWRWQFLSKFMETKLIIYENSKRRRKNGNKKESMDRIF